MILSRPKLQPQERFDLEDLNALLSASRTDAKLYTKEFLSNTNLILKGFSVTGIGLQIATVNTADATLIVPQGTFDFSWFIAAPGSANISVPASSFVDGVRNFVELSLATQDNTPLSRAFWDPDANSGAGSEFNQIINTITDLEVEVTVLTGGFSGLPDRLPVAIIDVDGSGVIKTILDRRELFYRLAKPENIQNNYAWGTKQEPTYVTTLNGVTGTFVAGEELSINTETADCVVGGTTSIAFNEPTGVNFFPGSTVTGLTSGASGTINTVQEAFSGVDKSLGNNKNIFDALMTEIKTMKNTKFWWEDAQASINGLAAFLNSLMVQAIKGASFLWDGTNFVIQDSTIMSPSASDVLGYIRLLGRGDNYSLCRQDGTGSSVKIPIAEKQIVYVQIPAAGTSRTFSGVGSGATNYQVANIANFVPSDTNYWLCYRELNLLYIRGYGELEIGESVIIDDPEKEILQAEIDAINAALIAPSYDETYVIISGSTSDNNVHGPISPSTTLTIPVNSRLAGSPQQNYVVGNGTLQLFLNGQEMLLGDDWTEVGSTGANSHQLVFNDSLLVGDKLTFRLAVTGGPSNSGGSGAPDDNFVTLPTSTVPDNTDFVLIWDNTVSAYRKQTRAVFLTGSGGGVAAPVTLTASGNIVTTNELVLLNCTSGSVTAQLPDPATCAGQEFDIVKIDSSSNGGTVSTFSGTISGNATFSLPGQWDALTVKSTGTGYVIL